MYYSYMYIHDKCNFLLKLDSSHGINTSDYLQYGISLDHYISSPAHLPSLSTCAHWCSQTERAWGRRMSSSRAPWDGQHGSD